MGNLVSFWRKRDFLTLESPGASWSASFGNDRPEPPQTSHPLDSTVQISTSSTSQPCFQNLTQIVSGTPAIHAGPDPYTLVVLADHELHAGRDSQVETLINEAYAAFDRQTNTQSDTCDHRP